MDDLNWSKEFCHPDIERLRQLCHGRERGTALAPKNLGQMALREICLQIEAIQRSVLLEHELPYTSPKQSFLVHGGEVAKRRRSDVCNCKRTKLTSGRRSDRRRIYMLNGVRPEKATGVETVEFAGDHRILEGYAS